MIIIIKFILDIFKIRYYDVEKHINDVDSKLSVFFQNEEKRYERVKKLGRAVIIEDRESISNIRI